ncbi:unnamed protein product [Rhizophagus irregularis]|nr:unnamed protein product [Rhizophagus irregularis]
MPITEQQTKNFDYADWIKKAIENNFIKYYDHTEFKNKKEIENSNSSVRKIFRSNWNNTNTNLFVKISYEFDVEKIVNELKMQKEVDFHINILRIYEISKLDNQYSLVLEYTDASQLASAIDFIHSKGIIHCNLHEENGTPVEYSDIYTACWSDDPDERPSIRIVVSCLQSIIDYSIKSITNEIEKKSLNNDFEGMMNDCNISTCNSASNFIIDDDLTSDFVKNNLSLNLTGLTNNVEKIIDKLIEHLIRMHDEWGYTIIETKEIINQNIQNIRYYYEKGEGIQKDINKAFEWYEKSAMQGHSGAQSSLGKLYKIEKNDLKKAFYWIEKAAKNGCKVAQLHLAYLHENGEGTQKDDEKATEWFETSAVQKCSNAQYVLG